MKSCMTVSQSADLLVFLELSLEQVAPSFSGFDGAELDQRSHRSLRIHHAFTQLLPVGTKPRMCVCMHECMCVCMHECMCVCMHACMGTGLRGSTAWSTKRGHDKMNVMFLVGIWPPRSVNLKYTNMFVSPIFCD